MRRRPVGSTHEVGAAAAAAAAAAVQSGIPPHCRRARQACSERAISMFIGLISMQTTADEGGGPTHGGHCRSRRAISLWSSSSSSCSVLALLILGPSYLCSHSVLRDLALRGVILSENLWRGDGDGDVAPLWRDA
mmetsp:Transcript_33529/g.57483  ORF Transcript_33529/g.57483 Transcript_33529/m.57483 type:complete len:135 (-) Transcript_33529:335-739(-)